MIARGTAERSAVVSVRDGGASSHSCSGRTGVQYLTLLLDEIRARRREQTVVHTIGVLTPSQAALGFLSTLAEESGGTFVEIESP